MAVKKGKKEGENNKDKDKGRINYELIFSLLSVALSIVSIFIASKANGIYSEEISLTHRPYVIVESFAYLDENSKATDKNEMLKIEVVNSPAKLIREEYQLYYTDENGKINEIERPPLNDNRIVYPSSNMQYTFSFKLESLANALEIAKKPNHKIFRKAVIDYKMLSSSKKYNYSAEWQFDKIEERWRNISVEAN